MGNWFELGSKSLGADSESFEVLNKNIGKDNQNAYYQSLIINHSKLDLNSFHAKTDDWMWHIGIDKNHIYTFQKDIENAEYVLKTSIIKGADPSSYQQTDFDWAKDHKNHFYQDRMVNVDYESFKVINDYFAKDDRQVYFYYQDRFDSLDAQTNNFRKINRYYARDTEFIYLFLPYLRGESIKQVHKIPYEKFRDVKLFNDSYLLVDDRLYFEAQIVEGINVDNLKVFDQSYVKDDQQVFYQGLIIEGADAKTFEYDKSSYLYRDKNNQYRQGKIWVPDHN